MIDRVDTGRPALMPVSMEVAGLPGRVGPVSGTVPRLGDREEGPNRVGRPQCAHSKEERRCDSLGRAGP